MKLISNFKDYYDSVLNSTFMDDDKLLFKRETYKSDKLISDNNTFYASFPFVKYDEVELNIKLYSLIFCGYLVNYILIEEKIIKNQKINNKIFKNSEEYFQYLKTLKGYHPERLPSWKRSSSDSKKYIDEFFKTQIPNLEELCYKYKTYSILNLGKKQYIINPVLKNIHFEKIKDPYTAAQDVYNYINGVLSCVCTPEVKMDNKDILVSKGFDPITSFRKM
jgi:hypothetical protein